MADGFEELMRDQEHYFSGALWAEASQGCRGSGWGLGGRSEREPLLRHTDAKGREKHRQLRFCLEG